MLADELMSLVSVESSRSELSARVALLRCAWQGTGPGVDCDLGAGRLGAPLEPGEAAGELRDLGRVRGRGEVPLPGASGAGPRGVPAAGVLGSGAG